MRKVLHFALLLFFVATFGQCQSTTHTEIDEGFDINIEVVNATLDMSEIFSDVEIINFSIEPIGKIKKLYFINDKLFLWATSGEQLVHVHDIVTGEHLRLGKLGKGPGEFISIQDVVVDKQWVYILDYSRKQVKVFSHNGVFSRVINLPEFCDNFYPLDSGYVVLRKKVPYESSDEFKLSFYREQESGLRLINEFLPICEVDGERDFYQLAPLYRFKGKVRFTEPFSSSIYTVNPYGYKTAYRLDFGDYALPHQKYKDEAMDLMAFGQYCMSSGCIWNVNCVLENQQYLFFTYRQYKKAYGVFFNKSLNKTIGFNKIDDNLALMTKGIHLAEGFLPMFITDSSIYFVAEAYFLHDIKNNYEQQDMFVPGTMRKELRNIAPSDNPVVLKYNFKSVEGE